MVRLKNMQGEPVPTSSDVDMDVWLSACVKTYINADRLFNKQLNLLLMLSDNDKPDLITTTEVIPKTLYIVLTRLTADSYNSTLILIMMFQF